MELLLYILMILLSSDKLEETPTIDPEPTPSNIIIVDIGGLTGNG